MHSISSVHFHLPILGLLRNNMPIREIEAIEFVVIGFDSKEVFRISNKVEPHWTGMSRGEMIGHALFTNAAPCMTNFAVAQRFKDAMRDRKALDEGLVYFLTLSMRLAEGALRRLATPTLNTVRAYRLRYLSVSA